VSSLIHSSLILSFCEEPGKIILLGRHFHDLICLYSSSLPILRVETKVLGDTTINETNVIEIGLHSWTDQG